MTTITPEIRKAIEQAGEQPVRLADPETNLVYIMVRADVYDRMLRFVTTSISGMRTR